MAEEFGETSLKSRLRQGYIKKLRRIEKEGTISAKEFERRLEVKI